MTDLPADFLVTIMKHRRNHDGGRKHVRMYKQLTYRRRGVTYVCHSSDSNDSTLRLLRTGGSLSRERHRATTVLFC